MVTTEVLAALSGERLPTRTVQAANLIRYIGDTLNRGEVFVEEQIHSSVIGSIDDRDYERLVREMQDLGLIRPLGQVGWTNFYGDQIAALRWDLTLAGWDAYERERLGQISGRVGFLAMKFNDPLLEKFAANVIKPTISRSIGYDLIDIRDAARAGVIDNLLREQIRDAAFVLVDLTHDNSGAYWEAGYAEGLGKPVIYLCERTKFEAKQTHFDTNHCMTVLWDEADVEAFERTLIATLRRSLNLFPTRDV